MMSVWFVLWLILFLFITAASGTASVVASADWVVRALIRLFARMCGAQREGEGGAVETASADAVVEAPTLVVEAPGDGVLEAPVVVGEAPAMKMDPHRRDVQVGLWGG